MFPIQYTISYNLFKNRRAPDLLEPEKTVAFEEAQQSNMFSFSFFKF